MYFLIYCDFLKVEKVSSKFSENQIECNKTKICLKLITDYLKLFCPAFLSTKESSTLFTVETFSSSKRNEFDIQTSRTIHINDEKSTNKSNKSIRVQCPVGPDYSFPLKQFGKKTQLSSLLVQELFLALLFRRKGLSSCMFCIKHKEKLTAEHNMEQTYITKGLITGTKFLKNLLVTNNLKHIELQLLINP